MKKSIAIILILILAFSTLLVIGSGCDGDKGDPEQGDLKCSGPTLQEYDEDEGWQDKRNCEEDGLDCEEDTTQWFAECS